MPQDEGQQPPAEGSFADLLAREEKAKSYEVGRIVRGRVVQIGQQDTFLDVGGKSEASIATAELRDEKGDLTCSVGDTLEATVIEASADAVRLSRRLLKGAQAREAVEAAARSGVPIEGRVNAVIKGGFEIGLAGVRAFCPLSQIDVRRTDNPASYVGQTFDFRVIEYRERGKNVVVSRRRLLEEAEAEVAEQTWKTAVPGAVLKGTVVSVTDFGAFVDLGGVRGLVHISEISHGRVERASDHLKAGQEVAVKVLKTEPEKNRISLSLKALTESPWDAAAAGLREGDVVRGRISRVVDFGAFVELAPGVDGLIHVSQATPELIAEWKAQAASRPEIEVRVLKVDQERRRVSLAPRL